MQQYIVMTLEENGCSNFSATAAELLDISHKWNHSCQQKHHFCQCREKQPLPAAAQSFCSIIHFIREVILNVVRRFCSFWDKYDVLS